MVSPIGRLGWLGFLWRAALINLIGMTAGVGALVTHPAAGGSLAFLILMAALFWVWFSIHARRRADAGLSRGWAAGVALAIYAGFAVGYLILAALWAVPEPQRDAFVTGGVMTSRPEALDGALWSLGGLFYAALGKAGALALSGLVLGGFGGLVMAASVFSFLTLVAPSVPAKDYPARANPDPAPARTPARPLPEGGANLIATARRLRSGASRR